MARPVIDLEPYKEEILRRHALQENPRQILAWLHLVKSTDISINTLTRRFKEWEAEPKRAYTEDTEELRGAILYKFYTATLNEKELLRALQLDGHIIASRALQRIRLKMGLLRQRSRQEDRDQSDRLILEAVKKQLAKGVIQGYGRTFLYTHMRQSGLIAAR